MPKLIRAITLVFAAICGLASCAEGSSKPLPPWRVASVDGLVQVMDEGERFRVVQPGEVLKVGAIVTTGSESSAKLTNGFQKVAMSSNSRLRVPVDRRDGITRVLHELGTILFDVDHKDGPHFQVETPLVTAVVKGTMFAVFVGSEATTVEVTEGLVEVRAVESDTRREVPKGYLARVAKAVPREVEVVIVQQAGQYSFADANGPALATTGGGGSAAPNMDAGPVTSPGAVSDPDGILRGRSSAAAVAPPKVEFRVDQTPGRGPHKPSSTSAKSSAEKADAPASLTDARSPAAQIPAAPARNLKWGSKEPDSPWVLLGYLGGIVVAWIILIPIMAIGQASLRDRRGPTKKKRRDVVEDGVAGDLRNRRPQAKKKLSGR